MREGPGDRRTEGREESGGDPAVLPSPRPAVLPSDYLWPVAVLACLFAFVSTHPIRPHDYWWHMAVGREIVSTGHLPAVDVYSYTVPGKPYPSYNAYWFSDVLMYEVYRLGGPAMSVFVHTLIITGTYCLVLVLCWRLSGNPRIAALAVLCAAALGIENWNLRPQAFSFLIFTLYLCLIQEFRLNAKVPRALLLAFPALAVVWVNCHGSSPLALVLLGVWLLETLWERWRIGPQAPREVWVPMAALGLAAAALLVNPLGIGLFAYLREMNTNIVVRHQPEWQPASMGSLDGIAFFVLAPLGLALLLWAGRARSGLYHWLMFLGFAVLAAKTGRAIIWFGLVLAPIVAELLPRLLPWGRRLPAGTASPAEGRRSQRDPGATILIVCFVGLMIVTLPWFKQYLPMPPKKAGLIAAETPVAATEYLLQHHLPPQVFHNMPYGSYLIWRAYPQYHVFLDSRIELYPAWLWDIYSGATSAAPGWQDNFKRFGVRTVMASRSMQPWLIDALAKEPGWQRVYEDSQTVIFVHGEWR